MAAMNEHPLIGPSLTRRISRLPYDPDVKERLIDRLERIVTGHDDAVAAIDDRVAEMAREFSTRRRELHARIQAEYQAVVAMVEQDYRKALGPLADYGKRIVEERDRLLGELKGLWNHALDDHNRSIEETTRAMKDEVKRYREEMFRIGKAAISAAIEQARPSCGTSQATIMDGTCETGLGGEAMTETLRTVTIEIARMVLAGVDALVEAVADQIARPGDELAAQADLYDSLAANCREKARLARALDPGGQHELPLDRAYAVWKAERLGLEPARIATALGISTEQVEELQRFRRPEQERERLRQLRQLEAKARD